MSFKPKHQRLVLALSALVALIGAALLAMWGLKDRAAYFVTPSDIAAGKVAAGEPLRLGGMVASGSLRQLGDGVTLRFVVTDGKHQTVTSFRGIPPSLFKEGSGVVAEGRLKDGTFVADNILAKHDERYMPPQLGNEVATHAAERTVAQ
ncbi:cytochrome c maturation protein CcmE [Sphingomonas mesophila]|uniref:cytochrome c maturation protein CcmE n=1 Tax=Sphingomonas mesophila TaxID=2303576 RepID=UPI000E568ED1|nr:cytochrome c maturation protein CcmE [Sphingomonas mesophila]